MAPSQPPDALKTLDALVQTASTLLTQLQSALSSLQGNPPPPPPSSNVRPSPSPSPSPPPDALHLARDASALIRAHGTKIALLLAHKPFTPSALSTVLGELIAGPIPALASSAQTYCPPEHYTDLLRRELASRAKRVLAELDALVRKIPTDGRVLFSPDSTGVRLATGPATGVLWAACDDAAHLSELGVAGLLAKKVDQWRETLCDIAEELEEWGAEEEDDDDDDDEEEEEDDQEHETNNPSATPTATSLSPQALLDDLMTTPRAIPKSDPHALRPRLQTTLLRLRLVTLFYKALTERRLKTLPPLPVPSPIPRRLDDVAGALAALPDLFGDLACAFYDMQPGEIDTLMRRCFEEAAAAGGLLLGDWGGGRDKFSDWVVRFQDEVRKGQGVRG